MDLAYLRRAAAEAGGGWLPAATVKAAAGDAGMSIDQLMIELIPLASEPSLPAVSGFHVGAVGQGATGSLYFGANLEVAGWPLNQTVHGEQSTVINAWAHGESGLIRLAVSAAPCGYCRQFLYELAGAADLEILLAGKPAQALTSLLPGAFGPADLGVQGGMLAPGRQRLDCPEAAGSVTARAALDAAAASYAPYTNSFSGAALTVRGGRTFTGPCLENAAFNPSLSPMQTAYAAMVLAGESGTNVLEAAIVELEDARIRHGDRARALLAEFAPGVRLYEFRARIAGTAGKGG